MKFGKNFENIINPIDAAFDGDQNVDVVNNGTTTEQGMNQRRCSKFKPVSKISTSSRNLILSSGVSFYRVLFIDISLRFVFHFAQKITRHLFIMIITQKIGWEY